MKLFLISQSENNDYDTYDSAVVAAENAEIARNMNPNSGLPIDWGDAERLSYGGWAYHAEAVKVEYLGEATTGTKRGVICASFNAG